jgi:hypothetical protein
MPLAAAEMARDAMAFPAPPFILFRASSRLWSRSVWRAV